MGKLLSLPVHGENKKPKNKRAADHGAVERDLDERQIDKAKRFKIFYDHLLGLLETAASAAEKTDFEKAVQKRKILKDGLSLKHTAPGFSADRTDVSAEALQLRQILTGPLEDTEIATALALALKEVLFRSFEGRRLSPSKRDEKQKLLTEYVVGILNK